MKYIILALFSIIILSCDNTYYCQIYTIDAIKNIENKEMIKVKAKNDSLAYSECELLLEGSISAHDIIRQRIPEYSIVPLKFDLLDSNKKFIESGYNKKLINE